MYDVNYFIKKFEAIPEENIIANVYGTMERGCAMGLCQRNGKEHLALYDLFNENIGHTDDVTSAVTVNNGNHPCYQQPTPKQRILAALNDIKKMQEPKYPDITKSLAVIVERVETDVIMVTEIQ